MVLSSALLVLELLLTSHSSQPHNLALVHLQKCCLGVFIYFTMSPILTNFPLCKILFTTIIINSEGRPSTEKFNMHLSIIIL